MGSLNVTPAGAGSSPSSAPIVKAVTPTSGQSLSFDNADLDQTFDLTPAGLIGNLTISFPSDGSISAGRTLAIFTTQTITLLTLSGATTIRNLPATIAGGTKYFFRKVRANTWDFWAL